MQSLQNLQKRFPLTYLLAFVMESLPYAQLLRPGCRCEEPFWYQSERDRGEPNIATSGASGYVFLLLLIANDLRRLLEWQRREAEESVVLKIVI